MRQVLVIVFAGFLAASLAAQENAALEGDAAGADTEAAEEVSPAITLLNASEVSLDDFLWLKRPIVVFADTPADPRYQKQVALLLERPEELILRDIVLIVDTDPKAQSDIRKKLRPRGFMLTLMGKDGRVNLRKPAPWDVREITRAIDKWPLRKQEILDLKAEAAAQ